MDANTAHAVGPVSLDRGNTPVIICTGHLIHITRVATASDDRKRAIAWEHLRLALQTFRRGGRPQFAGRIIYRMAVPPFNRIIGYAWRDRHYCLPIVPR